MFHQTFFQFFTALIAGCFTNYISVDTNCYFQYCCCYVLSYIEFLQNAQWLLLRGIPQFRILICKQEVLKSVSKAVLSCCVSMKTIRRL